MVQEMEATVIYTQLLKEDLVVIRILPDEGMPEYKTGQFLTIGVNVQQKTISLLEEHTRLHLIPKTEIILNLLSDG